MSKRERGPRDACERYAPMLALLDADVDAALNLAERDAALDHLAGCGRCQADQRAYARLDDTLRRAFGPNSQRRAAGATPLRTNELLAAIGATREPADMPRWAARPTRDAIRSVIYLGDFDGGFEEGIERMSEQDQRQERKEREEREGDQAAPIHQAERPERTMAAIPSLRPAPRRLGSRVWAMGFGATAVAVVLIVVAATLFSSRPRPIATQTAHAGATQTANAQVAAGAAALGPMAAVTMLSPTDGWALGDASGPQVNSEQQAVVALYHYDGSQWRLAQKVKGFWASGGARASITMLSATDGWAFDGTPSLLHYDGTSWRVTTIALPGNQQVGGMLAFDMVSPTAGWAMVYLNNGASGIAAIGFVRYDGQQWALDQAGFSLPANLDPATVNIVGLSAAPGGDPWAIGWANVKGVTPAPTSNAPQAGFALQRVNGGWQLENQFPLPSGATSMVFNDILMTSSTSGWIVGETTENRTQIGGNTVSITQPLLLRYDGSGWTSVSVPQDVTANDDTLNQIMESGPNNIWVLVNTNGSTIGANGVAVSATFLHYDGATWGEVTPTLNVSGVNSVSVTTIGLAPNGDLWAVGVTTKTKGQQWVQGPFFCQYADGAWNVVTPATSGA